jgi:APA family basic amino acid/polyamine antiporter
MGVLSCLMLMFSLPWDNWVRLFGWMAIGLVIYFFYGRKHSVMTASLARELAEHGTGGAYTSGTHEA